MQVKIGNTPTKVFQDADWALLLGAVPRAKGEEYTSLLRPRAESLALCYTHDSTMQDAYRIQFCAGAQRKELLDINGRIYQEQVMPTDNGTPI